MKSIARIGTVGEERFVVSEHSIGGSTAKYRTVHGDCNAPISNLGILRSSDPCAPQVAGARNPRGTTACARGADTADATWRPAPRRVGDAHLGQLARMVRCRGCIDRRQSGLFSSP
jgi:hypothetical protein